MCWNILFETVGNDDDAGVVEEDEDVVCCFEFCVSKA